VHDYYLALMIREVPIHLLNQHNDANIMIVPYDVISYGKSISMFEPFIKGSLDLANPKHQKRVDKLVLVTL
jgi:ribose 5-phosphate isomerase RpiB